MVKYNPRNVIVALVTAGALSLSMTACAKSTGGTGSGDSGGYSDCDLGDLREGDKDCKDPRAYRDAVRKYGAKKVAEAEGEYKRKHPAAATTKPTAKPTSTKPKGGLFGSKPKPGATTRRK